MTACIDSRASLVLAVTIVAGACLAAPPFVSAQDPPFNVQVLTVPEGKEGTQPLLPDSTAASGYTAGAAIPGYTPNLGGSQAVRWDSLGVGDTLELPTFAGDFSTNSSVATGVNEQGDLAGWSVGSAGGSTTFRALWWEADGTPHELPSPAGVSPDRLNAIAINGSQQITGYLGTSAGFRPVLWNGNAGGQMLAIPDLLPGDRAVRDSIASAINEAGQMAGWADNSNGARTALRWNGDGEVFILAAPSLPSGTLSHSYDANGINGNGAVVGEAEFAALVGLRAVRWDASGNPTLLETPTGSSADALDIDDASWVIGRVTSSTGARRAVLWDDAGTLMYVDDLVEDPDWTFTNGTSIERDDEWVRLSVFGSHPTLTGGAAMNVVLSRPVPEPASLGVLVLAGMLLLRRQRGC